MRLDRLITCGLALCLVALGSRSRVEAASLKVGPARLMIHDVEPGRAYDVYKATGFRLSVFNDDDTTRTWCLSTHRPSARGKWEKGYGEIPDASWCWFEKSEITVGPRSAGYAYLRLRVPDREAYYNQHWVVTLAVGGKPGRGGISLAADVRVQIETAEKADVTEKPDGPLGIAPSLVRFDEIAPGEGAGASVRLYNNDDREHVYSVAPLFDDPAVLARVYLTQSYQPLPEAGWLEYASELRIGPGESAELTLNLNLPRAPAHGGRRWEHLLLIEADGRAAGFIRVRIDTASKSETE
jgi:hypothetical protein